MFDASNQRIGRCYRHTSALRHLQKVSQQCVPVLGCNRLRMKLNAFDRQRAMTQAHDFTIVGPGSDFQDSPEVTPVLRPVSDTAQR